MNTPVFSPTESNCATPTQTSPPPFINQNGQTPPPYINPPPYNRQSSTLPGNNILRSSLRSSSSSLPRQISTGSVSSNSSGSTPGTIYGTPPYLAELQAKGSPHPGRRVNFQEELPPRPASPPKKTKKTISFNLVPQEAPALLPRKPAPPKRSENTKLTSPKKLANSNSAPPSDFLKDLQRVMKKKWQVAQKCKLEPSTTPHEVLGFRDPPPPVADYRETNVSNWVQEHYGHNLYENVYPVDGNVVEYAESPVHYAPASTTSSRPTSSLSGRRPPPPPPKRSETTHLTNAPTTRLLH